MNATSSMPVDLSVIVPAYNEAARIDYGVHAIMAYLRGCKWSWELIVVDDGSTDDTADKVCNVVADETRARLIQYRPNRGKGFAVRTGVLASKGNWVVFLDADLSTPVDEIDRALSRLQSGVDLIIGSRGLPDSHIERKAPFFRRMSSAAFDHIRNTIVGLNEFSDTQCGFKVALAEAVRPLYERAVIERFMFDVEILFLANQEGLRIEELPVRWADCPGSTVRFFPGVYRMFRDLLRIRRLHGHLSMHPSVHSNTPSS